MTASTTENRAAFFNRLRPVLAPSDLRGAFDALTVALSDDLWISMDDAEIDDTSFVTVPIYDPAACGFLFHNEE